MKNIYLSHKGVSLENLEKIAEQLRDKGYEVRASELYDRLKKGLEGQSDFVTLQITWCDIIFVLIGDSQDNQCVDLEIKAADNMEIPVVGVYMGGGSESIPQSLEDHGSGLVTDEVQGILSVLEEGPGKWQEPDGSIRKPKNTIDKGTC